MSTARVLTILAKDLRLGPRSPLVPYALVFPLVATAVIQLVFGNLFEPAPRLGIVDRGDSAITAAARDLDGIDLEVLRSERTLRRQVRHNDLDAGLVLAEDFDAALRSGRRPPLQLYLGGESLGTHRVILAVTVLGLVREVVGAPAPLAVTVDAIGDGEFVALSDRLIPLLVLFSILIAGVMVPAAALMEEKEQRTLTALLITPAEVGEVLAAKGALGLLLAITAGVTTLALNRAFGESPLALLAVLGVAALMVVEIGLTLGALARDTNSLFTVIKGGNVLLFAPVIFFIWPDLPQWIPRLFPTWYFLDPVYRLAVEGADLGDVAGELAVAVAICALLLPVVALAGRRMEQRQASS